MKKPKRFAKSLFFTELDLCNEFLCSYSYQEFHVCDWEVVLVFRKLTVLQIELNYPFIVAVKARPSQHRPFPSLDRQMHDGPPAHLCKLLEGKTKKKRKKKMLPYFFNQQRCRFNKSLCFVTFSYSLHDAIMFLEENFLRKFKL